MMMDTAAALLSFGGGKLGTGDSGKRRMNLDLSGCKHIS